MNSSIPGAVRLAMWKAPRWSLVHPDGSRYLTRSVLWGADCLDNHDPDAVSHAFVHQIHMADGDRHMHNHPWAWSVAVVLSGGYTERRYQQGWTPSGMHSWEVSRTYLPGDVNILRPDDYHSIASVLPNTVTLFLAGRETHDWGFLVDGVHVPHRDYMQRSDAQAMRIVREQ